MTFKAFAVATMLVSSAAAGQAPTVAATVNLVCVGTASKDETVGSVWDVLGGKDHTERVDSTDSVSFQLNPDDTGSARLPRRLQSAYREANPDGSFRLIDVMRGMDEITGRVRLHANYKMRFRLDRITGVVTLNGALGDFSGRCEAYDPETVQRKF